MGQKSSFQRSFTQTLYGQMDTIMIQVGKELINDFDISPDNNHIALACDQLRICDLIRQLDVVKVSHSSYVTQVKYSSDYQFIASSDVDSFIYIWNAKTYKKMYQLHSHFIYLNKFKIQPHVNIIASGSTDLKVNLWNFKTNKTVILEHGNEVAAIEYLCDQILITASFNGDILFWNLNTMRCSIKFMQDRRYLSTLDSSTNGQQVLSGYTTGRIKYWDTKSKKIIRKLGQNILQRSQAKAALSPDSRLIAYSFGDKEQIQILCSMTARIIQEIYFENNLRIIKLKFSNDSKSILWNAIAQFRVAKLQ